MIYGTILTEQNNIYNENYINFSTQLFIENMNLHIQLFNQEIINESSYIMESGNVKKFIDNAIHIIKNIASRFINWITSKLKELKNKALNIFKKKNNKESSNNKQNNSSERDNSNNNKESSNNKQNDSSERNNSNNNKENTKKYEFIDDELEDIINSPLPKSNDDVEAWEPYDLDDIIDVEYLLNMDLDQDGRGGDLKNIPQLEDEEIIKSILHGSKVNSLDEIKPEIFIKKRICKAKEVQNLMTEIMKSIDSMNKAKSNFEKYSARYISQLNEFSNKADGGLTSFRGKDVKLDEEDPTKAKSIIQNALRTFKITTEVYTTILSTEITALGKCLAHNTKYMYTID